MDPDKVLMSQMKSNIGRLGRTQVYSKAEGVFTWCGISRLTAELMAGSGRGPDPHVFLEVVCWLEEYMHPGVPRSATEIEKALEEEGYRRDTIKRAKKALHIQSSRVGEQWFWKLPDLPILLPPQPLRPLLQPLPPLPPLQENQRDTPRSGERGQEVEEAVVVQGAEVAAVVLEVPGKIEERNQEGVPPTTATTAIPPPGRRRPWW
jgi:hypothetical protein